MRSSIQNGFKKAFSAIFDGNITTLIASFVLMWLGSGTVKGFAYTPVSYTHLISRTISCIGTLESNEVHSFFNHIVVRYNTIYMISEKKASFKKFRIVGVENEKTVL